MCRHLRDCDTRRLLTRNFLAGSCWSFDMRSSTPRQQPSVFFYTFWIPGEKVTRCDPLTRLRHVRVLASACFLSRRDSFRFLPTAQPLNLRSQGILLRLRVSRSCEGRLGLSLSSLPRARLDRGFPDDAYSDRRRLRPCSRPTFGLGSLTPRGSCRDL